MNVKSNVVATVFLLYFSSSVAIAQEYDQERPYESSEETYSDVARVTSVSPRFVRVSVPKEECRVSIEKSNSAYQSDSGGSAGGMIVGGIVGGLLGSQVGGGSGKVAAAAAGAIGGAMVGNHLSEQGSHVAANSTDREVRRCRRVDRYEERADGYDVTYSYQGRSFTTRMHSSPGRTIPIAVRITPR